MTRLSLSIAMGDYDRTRAIYDGRVKIDGVDPITMLLSPEEMFFRAFRHQSFDVSELSLSTYAMSVARGSAHYVGIPVFLSRAFRHTSIYVRSDRGITTPSDLKGRRIGIAEYQLTANVWIRGILKDEYGFESSTVDWVRGGMDTAGRPEKVSLVLPPDIRMSEIDPGKTLNHMLSSGEIDGFIGPRAPRCFTEGHPDVRRLFSTKTAAEDYFARTRVFPIMHILGCRGTLVEQHPWLPAALLKAFSDAKTLAMIALSDTSATKVTMPFVEDTIDDARKLMGDDMWSYGIKRNETVLDTFLRYHFEQGLSPRKVGISELFHASTWESYSL
jgi:4,5-dihydroxyphthalate decarboxylase